MLNIFFNINNNNIVIFFKYKLNRLNTCKYIKTNVIKDNNNNKYH